ncbi:MAG: hypothetical protein O8C63_11090 [Candidatus Methanoperedens sp.]|nr:hypothetical protein [Candidatus Methanoperedens sp.]
MWAVLPLGAVFIVISIIIGLMINTIIIRLTMVLEGYSLEKYKENRFVHPIWEMFHKRQWEKFDRYRMDFSKSKEVKRALIYRNIYNYFSQCLYESIKNPGIDKTTLDENLKKHILPTELGNVFKSVEVYPLWKYGMDGVFFWTRIELLTSEENRKILEKLRAVVDMSVGLTWIFFFSAFAYILVLSSDGKYILSMAFFILFLLLSLFSYNMAVESALKFGVYSRSIFDLYREELWKKMKMGKFESIKDLPEKERWGNVFRYLWFFDTIQCPECGIFYERTKGHKCSKSPGQK